MYVSLVLGESKTGRKTVESFYVMDSTIFLLEQMCLNQEGLLYKLTEWKQWKPGGNSTCTKHSGRTDLTNFKAGRIYCIFCSLVFLFQNLGSFMDFLLYSLEIQVLLLN